MDVNGKYKTAPNPLAFKVFAPKCTMAITIDSNRNNLFHYLFNQKLDPKSLELIKKILTINTELLLMKNDKGITPMDLAVNKNYLLKLLLSIAYSKDKTNDETIITR